MRRVLVAALAATLLLAGACSSDDGDDEVSSDATAGEAATEEGGGDTEAFCDLAEEMSAMEEGEVSDEEALELLDELVAAAPRPSLEAALETLRMTIELPEDEIGEEQFGELFGAAFVVGAFLEEECGLADGGGFLGGSDDESFGGSFEGEASLGGGSDDEDDEPSGVDDVVSPGESPMSLDSIQAAMEERHGDEDWLELLSSWSVGNERSITVSPVGDPITPDQALAACEALLGYAVEHEPEASVTVNDAEGTTLVEAVDGGDCTPVG